MKYRILRLCNVYGITDKKASKKRNALQFLIEKLKKDEEISLYHDGNFYRNFMHVTDTCRAIKTICEKGKADEIYNVGSVNNYLFKDIIQIVIDETGSNSKIVDIQPPEFHKIVQVKDMSLDTKKLYGLGFEERISIEEGIKGLCRN
jgi:dTDP-glucose 4,6-dehydratase